jgi:hypothetical protein
MNTQWKHDILKFKTYLFPYMSPCSQVLLQEYTYLYNFAQQKNFLVASVLAEAPLNISFRRSKTEDKITTWF